MEVGLLTKAWDQGANYALGAGGRRLERQQGLGWEGAVPLLRNCGTRLKRMIMRHVGCGGGGGGRLGRHSM